jgi:hypothetical protein
VSLLLLPSSDYKPCPSLSRLHYVGGHGLGTPHRHLIVGQVQVTEGEKDVKKLLRGKKGTPGPWGAPAAEHSATPETCRLVPETHKALRKAVRQRTAPWPPQAHLILRPCTLWRRPSTMCATPSSEKRLSWRLAVGDRRLADGDRHLG